MFAPPQDVSADGLSARARSASSISGSPRAEIPVGHGQTRRGWVVVACLGYSRAGAGALIFSKQTPDLLFGIRRCLWSLGALPQTLVWDRQAGLHAGGGRPTRGVRRVLRRSCGSAGTSASRRDPQAKGVVERLQDFVERSFEPGRVASPTSSTSSSSSTPGSTSARTRGMHKTLRCRPIDRLVEEREVMAPLPRDGARHRSALGAAGPAGPATCASTPATTRSTRGWSAAASRSASPSARSSRSRWTPASWPAGTPRSFARHRTITALEHARALKRSAASAAASSRSVEVRSLARYDALIA